MPLWRSRPASSADCAGILALRQAVFGNADPVRATPEGWHWQFVTNPAGPGCIRVAEHEGRIVGQYAVIPTWLRVEGRSHRVAMSCDTMVHPDYQRQGMFVTLAREVYADLARQGIDTIWGWPNVASAPTFVQKLGWQEIGTPTLLAKPVRSEPLLAGWARAWLGPLLDRVTRPRDPQLTVTQVEAGSLLVPDNLMTQPRTATWLQWRYGLPGFGYHCYHLTEQGQLQSSLVLRFLELFGVRVAVVMDLIPWAHRDGLRAAWHLARHGDAALLLCLTTAPRLAVRSGFVPIPGRWNPRPWLLGARLGPACAGLEDISAWRLSFGDTDIV